MSSFHPALKFVLFTFMVFIQFSINAQGKYIKFIAASEYVELHNLQFEETIDKTSFENPIYRESPVHEKLLGMSFSSARVNEGFWEIGFLTGFNKKKSYYLPVSNTTSILFATEKVHNAQINFSKNMFGLHGENKNFHFGLCFNAGYRYHFNDLAFSAGSVIKGTNIRKVINQLSLGFFPKAKLLLNEKLHIEMNTLIHVFQIGNEYSQIGTHSSNILRMTNYGNLQLNCGIAYQLSGITEYIR